MAVTACRFVMAVVFIFSGFVKAVDPLGTQYKIQDYVDALGWTGMFPDPLPFISSVMLGIAEFCLGIYLFFGIRRIISPRAAVLLMAVMTPLTLWVAIENPVADCGCFGDAVVISNWATFWKNVVLLLMALFVLKYRKQIFPLATIRLDWLIALYSFVYIFCMTIYCYRNLPVFDFRPYYIGADICEGMRVPEGKQPTVYETLFTLKKNGQTKEFTLKNYPDSTWTFVDSKTVVKQKGYEPPIHDFAMLRQEDGEDITEQVLSDENYTFLLVAHQLNLADDSAIDLINDLYDYSLANGYAFYGLTSSSDEDVSDWQDRTGAEYPFCLMDNITLKTMVRSNPGIILLKNGKVINKWSVNNFPDEYALSGPLDTLSFGKIDARSFAHKTILVVAWFIIPLVMVCTIDLYWEQRRKRKNGLLNNE